MKIKKLLKNSLIFFSPFVFILLILFCINILIKILQEAIDRNTFNNKEIENIYRTIDKLNEDNVG